jgi:hypothetical protein
LDFANCARFETSITSASLGIQCDADGIFGFAHPYRKSIGNVVMQMVWALVLKLMLVEGLWCEREANCMFTLGGMFTTTSVRKLMFNGYTEPSVLKFMDLKYANASVGFQCEVDPFDQCGVQTFQCPTPGVNMVLPNGEAKLLRYGNTSNDEYFAPYFVVTEDSELLWPHAADKQVAAYGRRKMHSGEVRYTKVRNPHWAAYPAWTADDVVFNKHYQCQRRLMSGEPDLFESCLDTLYTGRDEINRTLSLKTMHGNTTIFPFEKGFAVNGSSVANQLQPSLWEGFKTYPYSYQGLSAGVESMSKSFLTLFNKMHAMSFSLYQTSLIFALQREFELTLPLKTSITNDFSPVQVLPIRRFVEDADTWMAYKNLAVPNDSYTMPYLIPIGMASLERYANFPLYAGMLAFQKDSFVGKK